MTLKELFLSSGEPPEAFRLEVGSKTVKMTHESYEVYADYEVDVWFVMKNSAYPNGAVVDVVLKEK